MAGFVKRRFQEKKKRARRELSRTLSLALAHRITSRVTVYKPTGPVYFVFCRLYPSYPQQPTIESIDTACREFTLLYYDPNFVNYYQLSDSLHVRISLFKKRINYEEDKSLQCTYFLC
jgi:hypothetical protein